MLRGNFHKIRTERVILYQFTKSAMGKSSTFELVCTVSILSLPRNNNPLKALCNIAIRAFYEFIFAIVHFFKI